MLMTTELALKGIFAAGSGGLLGWMISECTKENIRERNITPKATDSAILIVGLLGFFLSKSDLVKFFFGGLASIGFGRLLIQFEAGELESAGEQCPLKYFKQKIGLLLPLVALPGPP